MQVLQNIYEYLLDAETQLGSDEVTKNAIPYPENAGNSVPVAAGAGDTNICGGIIQVYWNGILERCLDVNEQVRVTALKVRINYFSPRLLFGYTPAICCSLKLLLFGLVDSLYLFCCVSFFEIVEIVLRQGLVHPITCVPCLIALETDPLEGNSKLAHQLLMNMNEKYESLFASTLYIYLMLDLYSEQLKYIYRYPAFFESRLGDGLQLSFRFMQSMMHNKASGNAKGNSSGNAITYVRPGISRIYRLIRGNRNSRNKFMHSIVRKFESGMFTYSSVPFLV